MVVFVDFKIKVFSDLVRQFLQVEISHFHFVDEHFVPEPVPIPFFDRGFYVWLSSFSWLFGEGVRYEDSVVTTVRP